MSNNGVGCGSMMKAGLAKPEEQRRGGGGEEGRKREENRGNGEKRMKKGESGCKVVWVCDLCLGSCLSPSAAAC